MEIKITVGEQVTELCPYCNTKPILIKTCGDFICQWKHNILKMRTHKRKTTTIKPSLRSPQM